MTILPAIYNQHGRIGGCRFICRQRHSFSS
jgi:hypothetical protein